MKTIPPVIESTPTTDRQYWERMAATGSRVDPLSAPCHDCAVETGFYQEDVERLSLQPDGIISACLDRWFCHNYITRGCAGARRSLAIAIAAAGLQAETICGKKYSTPEFHEIHIQCLPDIKQTRVVGRPKFGRAFEMSLPGQDWLVGAWKDEHGVTWTGVYFHGTEHEELPRITVLVPVGAL